VKPSTLYRIVGGYFRRRRARWLVHEFADCETIVDLGGTVQSWENHDSFAELITLVNLDSPPESLEPHFQYVQGDACKTAFPDAGFDLAFSNSVIEHVGDFENQRLFAREMQRVGRRVYCQTPNKWFPIEPHFLTLFIHWLPSKWFSAGVHRYLTLNGLRGKPKEPIRLLARQELVELFPGCQIKAERFLLLPKSFVAWK
jgi:Methyltransferase domain